MSERVGKVLHVSPPVDETVKQNPISCNPPCNSDETVSLKGLAHKVLLRNSQCNKHETKPFHDEKWAETASHSHFDLEAFDERAAIIESNGVPREWAEGFALFCTMPLPPTYSLERWHKIIDDGGYFLDRWGKRAASLGWQATDVFGVNPDAPERRYDAMGLVPLLQGRPVITITVDTAQIDSGNGNYLTFYRNKTAADAMNIWELKQ